MKTLSLKLDENIYAETEEILARIKKARNRYINDALAYYNSFIKKRILEERLQKDSMLVRDESMEVLKDFEAFEDEDPSV
jgi:hypothetical protein